MCRQENNSGPLLDRIDLHIEVPAVPFKELSASQSGTSSAAMRDQVLAARAVQIKRFNGAKTRVNAQMSSREIRQQCQLNDAGINLLRTSLQETGLSPPGRTTRFSAWRARLPISTAKLPSCRNTSAKR
jgi:predicted ATPase with chaperone activity